MNEAMQESLTTAEQGRLPVFHVEADSIPEAYYGALKAVHFGGPHTAHAV